MKTVLITGGTGSVGQALTKQLLLDDTNHNLEIRIFNRNENDQVNMIHELGDIRVKYYIGDIRDFHRLKRVMEGVDIVFHTAALKHVPIAEANPFEAVQTNVLGTQNVIDACLYNDVKVAILVGTDKAVSPSNTYGATKMLAERLWVNTDIGIHKTKFIATRMGNIFGSNGSVVPKFIKQAQAGESITITNPDMTRYSITLDKAVKFLLEVVEEGMYGDIFIPLLESYNIKDLANAVMDLVPSNVGWKDVGTREGEKVHEALISPEEVGKVYLINNKYVIPAPGRRLGEYNTDMQKVESQDIISSFHAQRILPEDLSSMLYHRELL